MKILRNRRVASAQINGHDLDFDNAKILFLRQNAIGDALISTPIYHALKSHYPNLQIDVLLNRRNRNVYDNDANIHRIYVMKVRPFDILPILRLIRRERYDYIVDLVHSPSATSSAICLLGNAGVTAGGIRERISSSNVDEHYSPYDVVLPALERNRDTRMMRMLAQALTVFGIDPDKEPLAPYYHPGDESLEFADALMNRLHRETEARGVVNTSQQRKLVGVNISGAKSYKYWGTENFIELIKRLNDTVQNINFLILYSDDYQEQAREISEATGAMLTGGTPSLDSFAATIFRLDGLISTDSSAVHLADIGGIPIVSLTMDPEETRVWCPSVSPFRTVHSTNQSLASISVDEVASAYAAIASTVDAKKHH